MMMRFYPKKLILIFLPFVNLTGFANDVINEKIKCHHQLRQESNFRRSVTHEMSALMCSEVVESTSISYIKKCFNLLSLKRPTHQSIFDFAIFCSGVHSNEILEARKRCLLKAHFLIKDRWSDRDKYILCANIKNETEVDQALNCYSRAKENIMNSDDPQAYAILCAGGKR